jgi:UDP-glucose 4-epimerase
MRSLVTGGAGFIGSHIVDALIERGHEVTCIDDESSESNEKPYFNNEADNIKCDITDINTLDKIFDSKKPNYVFHLAAESKIPPTLENPIRACQVNFVGTCNVLQASRRNKVKRVMYSSTSACYGLNSSPVNEDMKNDCLNPYSVSKAAGEDLCKMYSALWGLETIIFRYFNVYGERQATKGQYAPVISIFEKQIADSKAMTIIGDGNQTRDFVHVLDVVQANILAMEAEGEGWGDIFNVAYGESISINEVSKLMGDRFIKVPKREGEIKNISANISKIKKLLGFEPKIDVKQWIKSKYEQR